MDQQQAPISPLEVETPRPETPSDSEHIVTVHPGQRLSRIASASIASTVSRSSISTLELSSRRSTSEQSHTSPTEGLHIKTESPKNATPLHVKSSVPDARDLFPKSYLTDAPGSIPELKVDDDETPTWKLFCFCTVCTTAVLVGVVFGIYEATTRS